MQFEIAHLVETAHRNAAESREIAEAQRALVEKLSAEGRDITVARDMLRVAEATQTMLEAHLDQLRRAYPRPKAPARGTVMRRASSAAARR